MRCEGVNLWRSLFGELQITHSECEEDADHNTWVPGPEGQHLREAAAGPDGTICWEAMGADACMEECALANITLRDAGMSLASETGFVNLSKESLMEALPRSNACSADTLWSSLKARMASLSDKYGVQDEQVSALLMALPYWATTMNNDVHNAVNDHLPTLITLQAMREGAPGASDAWTQKLTYAQRIAASTAHAMLSSLGIYSTGMGCCSPTRCTQMVTRTDATSRRSQRGWRPLRLRTRPYCPYRRDE